MPEARRVPTGTRQAARISTGMPPTRRGAVARRACKRLQTRDADSACKPRPVWLFDLDNTLHNASARIFPEINRLMTDYIARRLGVSREAADALRQQLWLRYGATLLGLVRLHGVDEAEFLRETHAFDDIGALVVPGRGLAAMLRRLPGRKIVFTNGPAAYARQLLFHLGIDRHVDRCVAVEQMRLHGRLRPKPSRAMLRAFIARERLDPCRCVLVEDSAPNLVAARSLGVGTVLMTAHLSGVKRRQTNWAKLKIHDLVMLQRRISHFL